VLLLPARAVVPVALVVVAADALKPRVFGFVIDDNFSIPVGAAVTAWFVLEFVPPLV
jgi:dolichol kinase